MDYIEILVAANLAKPFKNLKNCIRFANPAEAATNFERPFTLELRSDRRETSATRVSDDLQISIF